MAVSIDTVYQRVLAAANKEQRGYITPIEFNLMANQAQMAIFEQYFYDRNQTERVGGNDLGYSDPDGILEEKIDIFSVTEELTNNQFTPLITVPNQTEPVDVYRVENVFLTVGEKAVNCEKISQKDFQVIMNSRILHPTIDRPVYTMSTLGAQYQIQVFTPTLIDDTTPEEEGIVSANLIRVPSKAEWGYVVVNERALYSAGRATNFELHPSEETNLVNKILELAGIILNKPGLVQIADQEDIKRIQQQKM
tara:strand:+ start:271 stop:1023 length:753 start_codon:yes stop_codon:yes gene_type:complete